jgi:phage tail-like protein
MRAERIARLLPEVYQRTIVPGTPIATLLDVMSELHGPVEDVLANLPDYFDPQLTPDRFVPFLARWVDLARWLDDSGGFDSGVGRLRQVVAAAAHLSRLRGTAQGLRDALEWATGVAGVRIDEEVTDAAGRARPFHVVVTLPAEAAVHRALVARIVQQEKPAHVTAEVVFEDGPAAVAVPEAEPKASEAPPTLPVGSPAAAPEPSFPGSEPAPVLTGVPEPEAPTPAPAPGAAAPSSTPAAAPTPGSSPTPGPESVPVPAPVGPPAAAPTPAPSAAPAPSPAPTPGPPPAAAPSLEPTPDPPTPALRERDAAGAPTSPEPRGEPPA